MKNNLILVVLSLLLSLGNGQLCFAQAVEEQAATITEISLERTTCLGQCPADEVVLRFDGKASYIGKSNVKQIGIFTGYIPKDVFEFLSDYLISQKFFEMNNTLPGGPDTNFTFINAVKDGKVKTVRCFWEPNTTIPQWAIAMAIRGVSADIGWQKQESGISGVLTTISPVSPYSKSAKTSNVEGNVTEQDKPLAKRHIAVQRYPQGHVILTAITDEEGKFTIGLPAGTYFLNLFGDNDTEPQAVTVQYNNYTSTKLEYSPKPK